MDVIGICVEVKYLYDIAFYYCEVKLKKFIKR